MFRLWLLDLDAKLLLFGQILLIGYNFFKNFGLGLHDGRGFFNMADSQIIYWLLLFLYHRSLTLKHLHVNHDRKAGSFDWHLDLLSSCDPLGGLKSLLLFLDSESLPGFKSYFLNGHVGLVQLIDLRIRELWPIGDNNISILLLTESIENSLRECKIKINLALFLHLLVFLVIQVLIPLVVKYVAADQWHFDTSSKVLSVERLPHEYLEAIMPIIAMPDSKPRG